MIFVIWLETELEKFHHIRWMKIKVMKTLENNDIFDFVKVITNVIWCLFEVTFGGREKLISLWHGSTLVFLSIDSDQFEGIKFFKEANALNWPNSVRNMDSFLFASILYVATSHPIY